MDNKLKSQAIRLVAMFDSLDGINLTKEEGFFLKWLSGWGEATVDNFISIIKKAMSKYGEPHEWRDAKVDASEIARLLKDNKILMSEFAESQRRELAAVSDLRETAIFSNSCSFCVHKKNLDICPNGDKTKCWKWRGPQE